MRNVLWIFFILLCGISFGADQPVVSSETPLSSLPYTPGLDIKAMDFAANPCQDFYQYSCGGWMKANPIPADQSSWSVYAKLTQENMRYLWGILDKLSKTSSGNTSDDQRKMGDLFASCMDEAQIEKLGAGPLRIFLQQIDQLKSIPDDLPSLLATLQMQAPQANLFFSLDAEQNYANSENVIAFVEVGGLGLPDRDYYLKTDAKSKALREKYVAHIRKTLVLTGMEASASDRAAHAILRLETQLAKSTLTNVERRDPYKRFHNMNFKDLQKLTPHFQWGPYLHTLLAALGNPSFPIYNVTEPKFLQGLDRILQNTPKADLQNYLKWHVASAMSPFLSAAFVNENFDFYRKTLRGIEVLTPRWKRCVHWVDQDMGEALGKEFVQRVFTAESKDKALRMTQQIESAMREDLAQLDWMNPETKKSAYEKLDTMVNKIGYPDKWRDYGALKIQRGDFAANIENGYTFEMLRELRKIGRPLDRSEWEMSPPTVNAYYDPSLNDINFPAGVLQPPLFDSKMDDAPNYGNTGGTIGHELTHAFDDEGRKFDAKGNLRDWWTKKDAKAFESRSQCIVAQYKNYPVVDELKINSELTEGEDIADLGGLILAWKAWKSETSKAKLENREGLTPEQRFFVGYAQWTCENNRPEDLRLHALTNEHSPGRYRVNGLVVNLPEFQTAFRCQKGDAMVVENRCRVW